MTAILRRWTGTVWEDVVPSNMVTTDTTQTISGTKTFTGNVTVGSTFTLANPGIGGESVVNFAKSSDSASIRVTETANDQTHYGFVMSDNPDGTSDAFAWRITDWQNPGSGWSPLYMTGIDTTFNARTTVFNGNVTVNANGFITSNNGNHGGRDFLRTTTPSKSAGTGTITLTVDASSYTSTGAAMWVKLDSATTFSWGTGTSTNAATQSALPITTTDTTLSNGVKVRFSATTGGVTGDTWTMRVYPGGTLTTASLIVNNEIVVPRGSAANVGYGFSTNGNTGMWSPGVDQLAFATGGTNRVTLTTTAETHTLPTTFNSTLTGTGVYDGANRVYSAGNAPPYPVTSVNTRTGAVTGLAEDNAVVHLAGAETISGVKTFSAAPVLPANAVALASISATGTRDANTYLRGDGTWSSPAGGVTSVNTRTGAVTGLAEDNTVVHLTGAETIAGVKTFTSAPVVPNSSFGIAVLSATGTRDTTTFLRGDGTFAPPPSAPVTSVAGRTGAVTLAVADVANAVSTAQLGAASGVATLDASGKLTAAQTPAIAITDTFVVASQAAMLALTAEVGDIAVRTDTNTTYILRAAGAATLANWELLRTPTDAVQSVNGRTGAVTGLAEANAVVDLTTAQTIAGVKTFSSAPVVPDSSFGIAKISATGTRSTSTFLRGDGTFAVPAYPTVPVSSVNSRVGAVTGLAEANAVVNLTTAQTIGGVKTFSSSPVVPDGTFGVAKLSATGTRDATTYLRGDNTWAVVEAASGNIEYQNEPPSSPAVGDVWIDADEEPVAVSDVSYKRGFLMMGA